MAKITNDELLHFRNAAQNYINRNHDRTKLHYALEKLLKTTKPLLEDYADKESDLRIDAALIDEKTKAFIMTPDRQTYEVDPTKAKNLQKQMRALNREEVEIEPYIVKELPKDLPAAWYQAFAGLVIEEIKDENLLPSDKAPEPKQG